MDTLYGYRPIIRLPGDTVTKVEELIDLENNSLDLIVLEENFAAPDVQAIAKTPIVTGVKIVRPGRW